MSKSKWMFVGSLKDENSDMAAYSAAGQITQLGFIDGCINNLNKPDIIYSMPLRRIFPKNSLILKFQSIDNLHQLGYINLPILKQISFALNLLGKVLRTNDYKFIISYNPSFILILCGLFIQKFGKIDFIPMMYDIVVPNKNSGNALLASINYKSYKNFLKYFKKTIVISSAIGKDFNINSDLIVIEGGLPKNTIMKFDSLNVSIIEYDQAFKIVFAGGLEQENGLFEMIDAIKLLDSDDIHLYIYGSGPLVHEVNKRAANNKRIHIMGYIEHENLIQHIKDANLLLNIRADHRISTKYFFPSKLIEYMYSGVPVLSTNFESLPKEYKTHLYITSEDPVSIAQSIKYIVDLPKFERDKKAISSKEWIIREKSWDKQSDRILKWALKKMEVNK